MSNKMPVLKNNRVRSNSPSAKAKSPTARPRVFHDEDSEDEDVIEARVVPTKKFVVLNKRPIKPGGSEQANDMIIAIFAPWLYVPVAEGCCSFSWWLWVLLSWITFGCGGIYYSISIAADRRRPRRGCCGQRNARSFVGACQSHDEDDDE